VDDGLKSVATKSVEPTALKPANPQPHRFGFAILPPSVFFPKKPRRRRQKAVDLTDLVAADGFLQFLPPSVFFPKNAYFCQKFKKSETWNLH
jgi:hypothetical protein